MDQFLFLPIVTFCLCEIMYNYVAMGMEITWSFSVIDCYPFPLCSSGIISNIEADVHELEEDKVRTF